MKTTYCDLFLNYIITTYPAINNNNQKGRNKK